MESHAQSKEGAGNPLTSVLPHQTHMTDRPTQRVPQQRPPPSLRACCAQTYKKKPWIQNKCEGDKVGKEPLGHATLMVCVLSLPAKTDTAFKAFLDAQNPRQQHSSTLESYLIKPIQRVLKYPLLLRELFALTDAESEEHYHLDGEPLLPPASTPHPVPTSAQASPRLNCTCPSLTSAQPPFQCLCSSSGHQDHEQGCQSHQ